MTEEQTAIEELTTVGVANYVAYNRKHFEGVYGVTDIIEMMAETVTLWTELTLIDAEDRTGDIPVIHINGIETTMLSWDDVLSIKTIVINNYKTVIFDWMKDVQVVKTRLFHTLKDERTCAHCGTSTEQFDLVCDGGDVTGCKRD